MYQNQHKGYGLKLTGLNKMVEDIEQIKTNIVIR